MKLLKIAVAIFFLCIFSTANAVPITKVQTFDRVIESGEEFHFIFVDLADYGFVAGVDKVYDWVRNSTLTFEFRDVEPPGPGHWEDSAFLWIFTDQARQFGRVSDEDWVGYAAFNQRGRLIPYVSVYEESAWLGDVTVTFDLLQNKNVEVPEPLPVALMSLGLFAIGMRRYRNRFSKK
ncbi:MAG: PEP-CTERM sorting domain-containing protein [Cellvibrio sp.]